MNSDEITPIFNEMARKIFNNQEEKHKRKKKYKEQYFCSDEEVEDLTMIFKKLIDNKNQVNFDYFKILFKEKVD